MGYLFCECCKNEIKEKYASGRFCSMKCARSFATKKNRKQISKKTSKTLRTSKRKFVFMCINCKHKSIKKSKSRGHFCSVKCAEEFIRNNDAETLKNLGIKFNISVCKKCKKTFNNFRGQYCSTKCYKEMVIERIRNGEYSGWKERKKSKPQFSEIFFEKVLDNNNIKYEREKKINRFFIDFAIAFKMIALEIDGKQHDYPERKLKDEIRDNILKKEGWTTYRIRWKNINSKSGKEYIKNEIKKFLEFYGRWASPVQAT